MRIAEHYQKHAASHDISDAEYRLNNSRQPPRQPRRWLGQPLAATATFAIDYAQPELLAFSQSIELLRSPPPLRLITDTPPPPTADRMHFLFLLHFQRWSLRLQPSLRQRGHYFRQPLRLMPRYIDDTVLIDTDAIAARLSTNRNNKIARLM
jgi:hypothetical protein